MASCSSNYPRASRIGWTHARHCPFLKCSLPCCLRFALICYYNLLWFVIRPASNVCPLFTWALRAISNLIFYLLLRAIFWFSMLFALLPNICPRFVWALRAVLFSYVLCPAVNDLPFLWALRAIICFDLLFALLLNVCPLFEWALRAVLFTYVFLPCC